MSEPPAGFAPEPPPPAPRKPTAANWRGNAKTSRGQLIGIALVLLLAIGGAIAGLIFWPRTALEPRYVVMPIDQYGPRWPVNPWAGRDAKILGDLFNDRASYAFNYQQADKFQIWLDWLAAKPDAVAGDLPTDFHERPLIVHLTALSARKPDGVYLLLPRQQAADFNRSVEWLKLDIVLDAVAACPAKRKLLLLDLAHAVADSFNGILDDDAPLALEETLQARQNSGKLPCAVIASCGPGQQSLSCDPERCSVFAFYLREGLRGAADADADDVIKIAELHRFLHHRVDRWARMVHGQRQTPRLYPVDDAGMDFALAYRKPQPEDRYDPPGTVDYPDGLATAWQQWDEAALVDLPLARARWTAGLLRAEHLALRAGDADRAGQAWLAAYRAWEEEVRASAPDGSRADVLKAARAPRERFRLPDGAAKPETLAELGKLLDSLLLAKPEEEAKARAAWQAKANEFPIDAARTVWSQAVQSERVERREIRKWADALAAIRLPRMTAEVMLLERLARYDFVQENSLPKQPAEAIAALLKAEAAVSRVAAAPPTGFAAVAPELTQADAARHEAEKMLFTAKSLADTMTAAGRLTAATADFDRVLKRLEVIRGSAEIIDAARIALLEAMPAAVEWNRPDFETWKATAETLAKALDQSGTAGAAALPGLTRTLRARIESAGKLLKEPRMNAADSGRVAELLTGAALRGAGRKPVWNAWRNDVAALHRSVRLQDQADDETRTPLPAPTALEASPSDAALRRAEAGVLLLAVAGVRSADLDAALRTVKAAGDNAAARERLGLALRTQWQAIPERLAEAMTEGRLLQADRMVRALPPELVKYAPRAAAEQRPGLTLARTDAAAQRRWVLNQMAGDAPLRARGDAATRFYDEVRTELTQP